MTTYELLKKAKEAERVDIEDYDGYLYVEEFKNYNGYLYVDKFKNYNDGFFEDLYDLEDYCKDRNIPLPEYAFACKERKHELDIEYAIEWLEERAEVYENIVDHLVDLEELYDFISKWNKKQNLVTYSPDYTRKVLLK